MLKKLIFTDLDGTLLDLESYSASAVKKSVTKLKESGAVIIFCSSKTWAEQEFYLSELQLDAPVIVENGSAIFLPDNTELEFQMPTETMHGKTAIVLGKSYHDVVRAIEHSIRNLAVEFLYYNNQTVESIAKITGLSLEAAQKAKTRDFSETIFNAQPESENFQGLVEALKSKGIQCIPGSRYVTVTGEESNKGKAVELLIKAYGLHDKKIVSIGIGDSRNDLEMLEAVDFPYLVKRPDNTWAQLDVNHLSKVAAVGPKGWNIMAHEILAY